MDGDQFNQLINEYLKNNRGFIGVTISLIAISLLMIIAGIVFSIIRKTKDKKLAKETVNNTNLETNNVNKEGDSNNGQN